MTDNLKLSSDLLVWVDMEMTGLNPDTDKIIEVAMIITNNQLEIVAQAPVLVIHQSDAVLASMDEWNTSTHERTGLTEKVRTSTLDEVTAEKILLNFIKAHIVERSSPLCGNTVGQDRRFMARYMPTLEAYVHYRNIDTSTLKELAKRWHLSVYRSFEKRGRHEALADILESIEELKHYRDRFLILPEIKD